MIDPAVERQYSDTKELLALWNTFHQFFTMGKSGQEITPEKENQFLEIKSRIAMLHDSFMDALTANQNVGQEVLSIITRAITLKHLGRLSTADVKKMEMDWHESYLLLNDTIAALEHKREELSQINETQYKAGIAAGAARQKAGKFFGSFYFKLAAIIVVVLGATIGVQMFGIYDYNELGKISALKTPFQWGKYAVRMVDPDSTWPTIDSAYRKGHSGWPEGVKPPVTEAGADKASGVQTIARRTAPIGIMPQMAAALDKAVEYRKETAEKSGEEPVEIYSFRFNNADDAKAVEKLWDDAESRVNTSGNAPEIVRQMDAVRDVNLVTFVFSKRGETMRAIVVKVYGKND